jgi:glutamate carboxypeptidase
MKDKILHFISANESDMLLKLKAMVLIQSGTDNKKGNDEVLNLVVNTLLADSLECRVVEQAVYGNHLLVSTCPSEKHDKQILMTGHMDTVFPADTDFNWFKQDEKYVYGPGVIDMKGGLIVGIYALKALASAGLLEKIPLTFVFNSDEEIGSPTSKEIIEQQSKRSAFAFVLECGGINGGIVTGRKGKLGCTVTAKGKAGHAAFAEHDKPSAILELSHKILEIEALNDLNEGLSVNVGTIKGGISPNTIPDQAWATADIRFNNGSQKTHVKNRLEGLVQKAVVPGTWTHIDWTSERLPMEPTPGNKALYQVAARQANELGIAVEEEHRSGVSDANVIASQNIPVIDGLGPQGARDHSKEEHMIKDSLTEKTQLLALLILESWRLYKEGKLF